MASRPLLCILSTGTGDRPTSIEAFHAAFATSGVDTSHVSLFDKPNISDLSEHLNNQDVVWIDRGSVVNLLAVWRAHGLDRILRDCWERGVVLGGESAGSLCWFQAGTTDSYGEVQPFDNGMGFLPFANAVHYGDRREQFHEYVASGPVSIGYATDAGAGLHFSGTELVAAVSDRKGAGVYKVSRGPDGQVVEDALEVVQLKRQS
ncbi:Type 1 glutamine amidotransferase-like domain-containing protein [Nocardia xishanensis]|uniref:Type 1 glutamine amidotransferase-like domain-containing protein n=1 Tax=Nocardia xishanensis TaxID=238964 RepID=UPI000A6A3E92|nr:peptidase E [Nocardia xishanensis]